MAVMRISDLLEGTLDMSDEARMQRAHEMGFNIEEPFSTVIGPLYAQQHVMDSWSAHYGNDEGLEYYLEAVANISVKGGRIFRVIFLKDNMAEIDLKNLGDHWCLDKEQAEMIARLFAWRDEPNGEPFLISADIPPNSIDLTGVDIQDNSEELEIMLRKGTPLRNIMINDMSRKEHLAWKPKDTVSESASTSTFLSTHFRSVDAAFDPAKANSGDLMA